MRIEAKPFRIENVKPDGIIGDGGQGCVATTGVVARSQPDVGGCGAPGCNCSPGHWFSVVLPRQSIGTGIVEGVTLHFDCEATLEKVLMLLEDFIKEGE